MLEFKADTPEYHLPIRFVAELQINNIEVAYEKWQSHYLNVQKKYSYTEMKRVDYLNKLVTKYYKNNYKP